MDSFSEYLEAVKNRSVLYCRKCGSANTTCSNFVNKHHCYKCGFTDWDNKFLYRTVGLCR
jgi:ribosomal protein L37E